MDLLAQKKQTNKLNIILVAIEFVLVVFLMKLVLSNIHTNGIWELVISSFLLLFALPMLTIRTIFRKGLDEYATFAWGNKKKFWTASFVSLVFFAIVGLLMLKLNLKESLGYSVWVMSLASGKILIFLFFELILLPVIVFSKEFFFRGFVMTNLNKSFGMMTAIFLQAFLALMFEVIFNLKGHVENFVILFIFYLLLGWVATHTRTIMASFLIHWLYIIFLDITIVALIK